MMHQQAQIKYSLVMKYKSGQLYNAPVNGRVKRQGRAAAICQAGTVLKNNLRVWNVRVIIKSVRSPKLLNNIIMV